MKTVSKPMRTTLSTLLIMAALAAGARAAPSPAAPTQRPTVTVADGALSGVVANGADAFLGIPYAAAPIGDRRWAPPAPAKAWTGVRDASRFASKCVQNGWVAPVTKYRNEDCLYLNVYRPAGASANAGLPVIFWIYGGAFVTGSSQDVDASALAAREKVVVVTLNYRLGVFGLAAIPAIQAATPDAPAANFGIQDQQAGLRWVKANTAAFGGDPANVTIVGQSAGSASVWLHLMSPGSAGLFKAAIPMSGSISEDRPIRPLAEETKRGPSGRLAGALGCVAVPDAAGCLRSRTTEEVFDAGGGYFTRAAGWWLHADGLVIPKDPLGRINRGELQRVPVVTGVVAKDAGFFVQARQAQGVAPWTAEDYAASLSKYKDPAAVARIYPVDRFPTADDAGVEVESDQTSCNALDGAERAGKHQPVYFYYFDDPDAADTIFSVPHVRNGPYHGSDIPYIFGSAYPFDLDSTPPKWTPAQAALSRRVMAFVAGTARSGRPGPDWKSDMVRVLSPGGDFNQSMGDFRKAHNCSLFE